MIAWKLAVPCLLMLATGFTQIARSQSTAGEYQIKAAFLFHFAQLVEWPAGALNNGSQTLSLCIFDDDPHGQELQSTIEGKIVGTRTLHLRQLDTAQEIQGCNILFLSRDEARRQTATLKSLHGQPILTVGESPTFLLDGGMIRFRIEDEKIRFDINLGAADAAHLKISSRLLLLASVVTRGSGMDRVR